MIMAISFITFIIFLVFFLYFPVKILFNLLRIEITDKLTETGLILTSGTVLLTLISLIVRFLGLNFSVLWVLPVISLFYLIRYSLKISSSVNLMSVIFKRNAFILSVILVGVIGQNIVLFRGGWQVPAGFVFPSMHDTMWNIALSAELFAHFPPENPAIAGVMLKNNHYFYPLLLAASRFLTGISVFDLYFRWGPIFVSLLFGLGLYAVSTIFTKKIIFRSFCVFLGYFSGNFAYLLPLFLGSQFDWKGNSFFADQPFDQIINPYSVLGFTLMLFGIYCAAKILQEKKNLSAGFGIIGGLLLGSLYGFKSFGGVTVILALIATTFLQFIFYRRWNLLVLSLISLFVFSGIFFFTTDPASAYLIWSPGWLLTQMMTDRDKLYLPRFAETENYYKMIGNRLGFLKIKFTELTIYLLGNLGTRTAGLIYLVYILFIAHVRSPKYIIQFIGALGLIAFSIPLLFNLRNSTFNIIQFTPYGLVLLAVLSGAAAEKLYEFCVSRKKKTLAIFLLLGFLLLSVPVNVNNIAEKLAPPKDVISNEEMSALAFLKVTAKPDDIILIDPSQFHQDAIYVPAISEHRVFLASPGYAIQTGLVPQVRESQINDFFKTGDRKFLVKNKISYIYLLKSDQDAKKMKLLEDLNIKAVFDNSQVIIWKVAS